MQEKLFAALWNIIYKEDERRNECLNLRMIFGSKTKWAIHELEEKGPKWTIECNFKVTTKRRNKKNMKYKYNFLNKRL